MSEEQAFETFKALRWVETNGEPVCPKCGGLDAYEIKTRKIWTCRACRRQFSITSGTTFASRKLPVQDYLFAIALFVEGAKGVNAVYLQRRLEVQYKTAFVLAHKLRETMGATFERRVLSGRVEVDGTVMGGFVRLGNIKAKRPDIRRLENQSGTRQSLVFVRERGGLIFPIVAPSETKSVPDVMARIAEGSTVYVDESNAWNDLELKFDVHRVNHKIGYSRDGHISTNWVESAFARVKRSKKGVYHRLTGKYLIAYGRELAWREDHRRTDNRAQFEMLTTGALNHPISREWKGYWQRRARAA